VTTDRQPADIDRQPADADRQPADTDRQPADTGRLRLTGWAVALLALNAAASIPLFVLTIVGLPLIGVFGVGIPLFLGAVWLTRGLADVHRWIFARAVDVKIPRPYRPWPGRVSWTVTSVAEARSVRRQLVGLVRESATWRDLAWLLVNGTVGFTAQVLVITLAGGIAWFACLPLLWAVLEQLAGPGVTLLRTDFGIWAIDSQAAALAGIPVALVFLLLWWWLTPPVLRGYARLSRTLLGPTGGASLAARVRELTESRAETVDTQAAELRRIERDLHDGAQARLVSVGMSLGMAEELLRTDPEAAARLLAEAREGSGLALAELRELVRGMHPPVLADRGLPGAVRALALAHPLPVEVTDQLPGRPAAPVESAAYFAVAEILTNVTKHARATSARVRLGYDRGRLMITVSDDGRGGAVATSGGGLDGVVRRLTAFDGTVTLTSPPGGPTVVFMEIPCELSPARITPS
jgi:signal transduction histidine kinase